MKKSVESDDKNQKNRLIGDQSVVDAYVNWVNACMNGNLKQASKYWAPVQVVLEKEANRLEEDETLPVSRFPAALASDAAAVLQLTTQGRKLEAEEVSVLMQLSDFQRVVCTHQIDDAVESRCEKKGGNQE